jgi:hypothetical protein
MVDKTQRNTLELVQSRRNKQTGPKPPRQLGTPGSDLWNRIIAEYRVEDAAGIELLTLACQALDRAEALRERVERDGAVINTRAGLKCHPAVRDELANRAFVSKQLQRLGLNFEPLRAPGRPSGPGLGIEGTEID